jgi:hypothetical protein
MIIKKFIFPKLMLLPTIFFFAFCSSFGSEVLQKASPQDSSQFRSVRSEKIYISKYLSKGDTLWVIHFHPTVQCSCCINVGNFAKKGLEKYYAQAYKEGRIVFKEYNIDEDSSTAKKYKIFWSALGFEKLSGGKNEFKEIESVWDFCEDEVKFLPNFKKELDEFMFASKKKKSQPRMQNEKTSR